MSKQNWEPMDTKNILKNIELVFKSKDINKLSKKSYDCLYLMSGFIAHYDINGFKDYYEDLRKLVVDILSSMDTVDAGRYIRDTWFENEYGYIYCASKTATYIGLKKLAEQYRDEINNYFSAEQKDSELNQARLIAEKYGYKVV